MITPRHLPNLVGELPVWRVAHSELCSGMAEIDDAWTMEMVCDANEYLDGAQDSSDEWVAAARAYDKAHGVTGGDRVSAAALFDEPSPENKAAIERMLELHKKMDGLEGLDAIAAAESALKAFEAEFGRHDDPETAEGPGPV